MARTKSVNSNVGASGMVNFQRYFDANKDAADQLNQKLLKENEDRVAKTRKDIQDQMPVGTELPRRQETNIGVAPPSFTETEQGIKQAQEAPTAGLHMSAGQARILGGTAQIQGQDMFRKLRSQFDPDAELKALDEANKNAAASDFIPGRDDTTQTPNNMDGKPKPVAGLVSWDNLSAHDKDVETKRKNDAGFTYYRDMALGTELEGWDPNTLQAAFDRMTLDDVNEYRKLKDQRSRQEFIARFVPKTPDQTDLDNLAQKEAANPGLGYALPSDLLGYFG